MYGTVARVRVKRGQEPRLLALAQEEEELKMPGFLGQVIYRMDKEPNEYLLVVMFADKQSYVANADSPDQDARYRRMLELLEGPPQWHDGEIVHAMVEGSARLSEAA